LGASAALLYPRAHLYSRDPLPFHRDDVATLLIHAIHTARRSNRPILPGALGHDDDFGLDVLVENASRIEAE
jgi:hypothetical protein